MKKLLGCMLLCTSLFNAQAQQKEFEGLIVYKTELTSNIPEVSSEEWKQHQFSADTVKYYFRNGFYRASSPLKDVYYYPTEQKIYYKYKGVDSLFYSDYKSDSNNVVLDVVHLTESSTVNNFFCKKLQVRTSYATFTYDYAPELYLNPVHDLHNTTDRYDAYIKEAKSVTLKTLMQWGPYNVLRTAISTQPMQVNDSVFELPNLPKTKYNYASIADPPKFKGGVKGYMKFLQKNLNGNLARDYIKIPPGEKTASVLVKLLVVVNSEGKISFVDVLNKQEVHPALARDATGVLNMVPALKPAVLNGKKIPYIFVSSVTYMNTL